MAKRRVVRKLKLDRHAAFEERIWPLLASLVVLGGFLLGAVMAHLRMDDPRWYANALTWLLAVPLAVAALMVLCAVVDQRWFRRGMQLAVVVALFLHAVFFISSLQFEIFPDVVDSQDPPRDLTENKKRVVLPEYFQHKNDDRPKDFEKPVETETPTPQPKTPEIQRPQPPQEQQEVQKPQPPTPTPENQPTPTPNVVKQTQPQTAAPRHSLQPSQLSRQDNRRQPAPTSTAVETVPTPKSQESPAPRLPQPQTAAAKQTPSALPVQKKQTQQPQIENTQPKAELARKTPRTQPRPETSAAAAAPRRINKPAIAPRTQVAVDTSRTAAPQRTDLEAPKPQAVVSRKQNTSSPTTVRPSVEPIPEKPTENAIRPQKRESPAEARPQVARTPLRVPNRQTRETPRPEVASAAVPTIQPTPTPSPQTSPAAKTSIAKRSPTTPTLAKTSTSQPKAAPTVPRQSAAPAKRLPQAKPSPRIAQAPTPAPARTRPAKTAVVVNPSPQAVPQASPAQSQPQPQASPTAVVKRTSPRPPTVSQPTPITNAAPTANSLAAHAPRSLPKARVAPQPTVRPNQAPSPRLARAAFEAALESPRNIEAPAMKQSPNSSSSPAAQPARTALAKALQGVAGGGPSNNMVRAQAPADSPALTVSAAARRNKAQQKTPTGPAVAPSQAALVKRSVADQTRPSALRQTQSVPVPKLAAAQQPADIQASSSAALTESSADADRGPVNAARGETEVDLGPTLLTAEPQKGLSGGGGQPTIHHETEAPQLARKQPSGAAAIAALAVETRAEIPAAPDASGGGQPATPPQAQQLASVRNLAGDSQPVTGGPASPAELGPLDDAPAMEKIVPNLLARADAAEALLEELLEGGGEEDDEEEEKRRLARAAQAGPQIAANVQVENVPAPGEAETAPAAAQPGGGSLARSSSADSPTISGPQAAPDPAAASGASPHSAPAARRVELVEAPAGPAVSGGGSNSPARSARGPALAANTQAETIAIVGGPTSSGQEAGTPLEAQGVNLVRQSKAAVEPNLPGVIGAMAGEPQVESAVAVSPGLAAGPRRAGPRRTDGPGASSATQNAAPIARRGGPVLPPGLASADIQIPSPEILQQAAADHNLASAAPGVGRLKLRSAPAMSGALPVRVNAPEGSGGLGAQPAPLAGVPNRRARRDSQEIHLQTNRFLQKQSAGPLALNTRISLAVEAFQQRRPPRESQPGGGEGASPPETEEAIEMGLTFLARYQRDDGSWSLQSIPGETASLVSDTAATGLALLAFQGAGYHHRDYKYKEIVRRGVQHLIKYQKPDGDLFTPLDDNSNRSVRLYSHGIAALALCEAYGMTQDAELRQPAQKALEFIEKPQDKVRGGWRYTPGYSSDTSVTGWMLMALKSGQLAGLKTSPETYRLVDRWLKNAAGSEYKPYLYRYNPYAPDTDTQRHGLKVSKTMTSVGLLMRLYGDWKRDDQRMINGADYLAKYPPDMGVTESDRRDTYYWYYATQVMFHMGGKHWENWRKRLHAVLIGSQEKSGPMAGSWDPLRPVEDRWASFAGRIYVTAMNLLSLEVKYRHLPLYDDTGE